MKLNLASKVLLAVSALLVVPVLVVFWYFPARVSGMTYDDAVSYLSHSLDARNETVQENIRHCRYLLKFLRSTDAVKEYIAAVGEKSGDSARLDAEAVAARKRLVSLLRGVSTEYPACNRIRLFGVADGGRELVRICKSTDGVETVPENIRAHSEARAAFDTVASTHPEQIYVHEVSLAREDGRVVVPFEPVLRLAVPLHGAENKFFGLLMVELDFYQVSAAFSPRDDDRYGSRFYLCNQRGDFLLNPDDRAREFGFEKNQPSSIREILPDFNRVTDSAETTSDIVFYGNDGLVFAVRRIHLSETDPGKFIYAVASAPEALLNAAAGRLKLDCLAVIGIVLVVFIVVSAGIVRLFARRLGLLAAATDAIASGKRDVAMPVFGGGDEISVLSKSLNAMCVKLERQRRELEELNESLEERIDTRTVDLSRLNKKLAEYAKETEVQAQLAKQSDIYKTQFLANMSHDIRTPLNGILGMADIIRKTDLTAEQKEFVEDIISSGELLAAIINDILDLSRIEAGRLSLEKRPFDMKQVTRDVCRLVANQAEQKNLFFYHDYPEDAPRYVVGDAIRVSQILMNLLSNAVKFTDVGGVKLEVATSSVDDGTCVFTFKVHDTGIGIPADRQNSLFEKFVQLDDSITRRRSGVGLGLSICRKLTEIMNGSIKVDSKYGKGSTFTVEIPLPVTGREDVRIVAEDSDNITLNWRRKPRVLVAEDSKINQKIVCKFIEDSGCECALAEDGFEAIELFKKSDFDLVFVDIQMPNLDGVAATREIRKIERQRRDSSIPLIALTAHVMAAEQKACVEAGADGFLFKPLAEKNLKTTLKRYLRSLLIGGDDEGSEPEPIVPATPEDASHISTDNNVKPGSGTLATAKEPVAATEQAARPDATAANGDRENEAGATAEDKGKATRNSRAKDAILAKTLPMSPPMPDIDLSAANIFNRQKAINNFAGNRELLDEMVAYFVDNLDRHLDKLDAALQQGDFKTIDSVSHLMKGEAATLCIERVQLAAGQLEQGSRNRDLDVAKRVIGILKAQIDEFREEIKK